MDIVSQVSTHAFIFNSDRSIWYMASNLNTQVGSYFVVLTVFTCDGAI